MFSLKSESDIPDEIPKHLLAPIEIFPSKTGDLTARDGGKFLHSAYNPLREAESAAKSAESSIPNCAGIAFFSCGLGYTPIFCAKLFPKKTLIIIEHDPRYFFTALANVDWTPIFELPNCIIALGTGIDSVVTLIEKTSGLEHTALCENSAQSEHTKDYFKALRELVERNKRKNEINASTLEKFSKLWLKNTCKNLHFLCECDGVNIFRDFCPKTLPVVILAAGPTLQEILPDLAEIKKRAILIAVDTALRACLRVKVEPDFVILTDPQYYAWRHIAGLSSPQSILITESAAYPPVFRFKCKRIILCGSLFPLGKYIEKKFGNKGELVAGGSVSTTAWDFARFIGAKEIFCAGLDLGFPDFQTHIRGSTFEEAIHTKSTRFNTAEKSGISALFGAGTSFGDDYMGKKILTDSKMKMFAWWFESKAEEFKERIKSYSLSEKSLKIPGFLLATKNDLLAQNEKIAEREKFLKKAENFNKVQQEFLQTCSNHKCMEEERISSLHEKFSIAIEELKNGLLELYTTAKKGLRLAEDGIKSQNPQKFLTELEKIDSKILKSEYKEIVSLVFPTEKRLNALIKNLPPINNEIKSSLQKSRLIYNEIMEGITLYQKYL